MAQLDVRVMFWHSAFRNCRKSWISQSWQPLSYRTFISRCAMGTLPLRRKR